MQLKKLVKIFEQLATNSSRLKKTEILANFLKEINENEINQIVLLMQGRVFPQHEKEHTGISTQLVIKSLNIATGTSEKEINKIWAKTGDLGEVAEKITKSKSQMSLFSKDLSVNHIYKNLKKIANIEGTGSIQQKTKLIAQLLTSASGLEAKYIVRIILEDLRIGIGSGTIRDAIVQTYFPKIEGIHDCENCQEISNIEESKKYFKKSCLKYKDPRELYNYFTNLVQEAIDISNDFRDVIKRAEKGIEELEKISLQYGNPIKVMLYQKVHNIEEAFEKVGKPCAFEYKYDGFRLQIHKTKDKIILFTRQLENVTEQFPDITKLINKHVKGNCIIDSETIGIDPKTGKWLPFQNISQRIKRKYDIDTLSKKVPVMLRIFDIMKFEDKDMLYEPFEERVKTLKKIIDTKDNKITLAEQLVTDNIEKANAFYQESLSKGNEGIMAKNLKSKYKPGSRVGFGVKIKPIMDNLDLVITKAETGTGKRGGWLTSFTLACKDGDEFKEIGKVGTGFKEKDESGVTFDQMTKLLKPLIEKQEGTTVIVKPKIVLEISYEEIQKSSNYSSKFALRFPRVINLREDKPVDEISTIKQVQKLFEEQRHNNRK